MNRPIYSFGAAVSLTVCLYAEIVFSGALRQVYTYAGDRAWICVLISAAVITALIPVMYRAGASVFAAFTAALYFCLILSRLAVNITQFKTDSFAITVIVSAVVLSGFAAYCGMRGAGIFCAAAFIPVALVFILCCIMGMGESVRNSASNTDIDIPGLFMGTLYAFSVMSLVLLTVPFTEKRYCRAISVTSAASGAAMAFSVYLGTLVFGASADRYLSVISEISKNVSVGKFFQRLEGLADITYIITLTAALVLIPSVIGENLTKIKKKYIRTAVVVMLCALSGAVACLSLFSTQIVRVLNTAALYSGIAVAVTILICCIGKNKLKVMACMLAPMLLLCSCNAAGEIENQTYVVITCCDSTEKRVRFITEDGSKTKTFSVDTDDFQSAVENVERTESVELSFEQMGLLMLDDKCDDITGWINTVLDNEIPNSAYIVFSEGKQSEIYENYISRYDSAFDFVSALSSSARKNKNAIRTVSRVNTQLSAATSVALTGLIGKSGIVGAVEFDGKSVLKTVKQDN